MPKTTSSFVKFAKYGYVGIDLSYHLYSLKFLTEYPFKGYLFPFAKKHTSFLSLKKSSKFTK